MNENHDSKTGEFSSGAGGSAFEDKMARYQRITAENNAKIKSNEDARKAEKKVLKQQQVHAMMDRNTTSAHEHLKIDSNSRLLQNHKGEVIKTSGREGHEPTYHAPYDTHYVWGHKLIKSRGTFSGQESRWHSEGTPFKEYKQ